MSVGIPDSLRRLINDHGNLVRVQGEPDNWRALVSPLRYRNKLYVEETSVPAGMIDRTAYLYIGLPENDLTQYERGTIFVCDGELLTLSHAETTYTLDQPLYVWAIFNRYGKEEES